MELKGQRVVVLGGSSGIGLAVAQAAAQQGAELVIASSRRERVDAALASLPKGSQGHAVDLGSEPAIRALFEQLGALDHLVFTAGESLTMGPLAQLSLERAQAAFGVRYFGALLAAKYAAPNLRAAGSITLTTGSAGKRPQAGWAVAASICTAMEGLTRALAVELAPIRVNLVSPGFVKSPLWSNIPERDREAMFEGAAKSLPVRHVATPEEIAESYLYAMRQTYATGELIGVNGGGVLV